MDVIPDSVRIKVQKFNQFAELSVYLLLSDTAKLPVCNNDVSNCHRQKISVNAASILLININTKRQ